MKRAAAKSGKKEERIMKERVGYRMARLESIKGDAGFLLVSQTLRTSAPPTAFCFCNLKAHHLVPSSF